MIKSLGGVAALTQALTPLFMPAAFAHDGWVRLEDGGLQLEGTITAVFIGNPLARLEVDVAGTPWRVDLAPLAETLRSGLAWGAVNVADDVIAIGTPSRRPGTNRLLADSIVVNGVIYDIRRAEGQRGEAITSL